MFTMKVVIDTSTLISLAKIGFLNLLLNLENQIVIPQTVYNEAVVKGEKKAFSDALVIKNFIKESKLEILPLKKTYIEMVRRKTGKTLAKGDESVLACVLQEKAKGIITNDDGLGRIAMALRVSVSASSDLLFNGLKKRVVNLEDYEIFLRNLVLENRITSAIAELYIMEGKKYAKDKGTD